jgi:response regulator RpfG family c-di-GMP phosphodiesterase
MAVTKRKAVQDTSTKPEVTILCVDDELSILESLKRFFAGFGWETLCANSGAEGFVILEEAEKQGKRINIVISDMRMPEMNGAEFLTCVRQRFPDIVRILLTGFSDIGALTDAINNASIFNYVAKPWDERLLHELILSALNGQRNDLERKRLQRLTQEQNLKLQNVNAELEDRVNQRTKALKVTLGKLERSHAQLQNSYNETLQLLSHIIQWQGKSTDSDTVADTAIAIARKFNLENSDITSLGDACRLKDIGLLAIPESIRQAPLDQLNEQELKTYKRHPIIAEAALANIPSMQNIAQLVRNQHEYLDGTGYPDRLTHHNLSVPARILSVICDYYDLSQGKISKDISDSQGAIEHIKKMSGKKYDANLTEALEDYLKENETSHAKTTIKFSQDLEAGMQLAQHITSETGVHLLTKDTTLSEIHIQRLIKFEKDTDTRLNIHVYTAAEAVTA